MPDTTVKLQDITPVKSTFDNDDQLLLINPTGEARISKEDFLDAMPDDAITLIGDITTTGIEGDTVAKQLGALENSKAPVITETTESSAIANFTDGADDMPLHNILAEINPVQDLTYGDPYPAGGSKNLLNMNADITVLVGSIPEAVTITTGEGTASITETYYSRTANIFGWAFNVEENADYTVSCMCSSSGSATLKIYTSDGTTLYSNNLAKNAQNSRTFSSGSNTVLYFYVSVTSWGQEIELSNLQIEKSSSATSYMPYANICPITGWTGCNVTRTGKNLYGNGNTDTFTREKIVVLDPPIPKGKTIISAMLETGSNKQCNVQCYENANVSGRTSTLYMTPNTGGRVATVAIQRDWEIRAIIFRTGTNWTDAAGISGSYTDIQIEFGSTATTYEPYITPTTASLSWQTEAGTVYGGTIDVATGLLTVDRAMVDLGTLSWTRINTLSPHWRFWAYLSAMLQNSTLVSTQYVQITPSSQWNGSIGVATQLIADTPAVMVSDERYETAADFKTAMSGVQLVYELATPQTYQLTPQEVKTLLGTNNVWADTGDTSVTYPADTKMFIEKLTMPTEDDLVANQAITSGKYFMIGNSLYLALANIASGAQITIGTNAQRVSLADALNTINS